MLRKEKAETMTKFFVKILSMVLMISILYTGTIYSQGYKKKMQNIVSILWYNFEKDTDYVNPVTKQAEPKFTFVGSHYLLKEKSEIFYVDNSPVGLGEKQSESQKSLGLKCNWERKGYNWVDLIPEESQGKLPGFVKSMDIWVWGANYNYDMQVFLEDYKGYIHDLDLGSLRYYGWRNLNTTIPNGIPQSEHYVPRTKGLRFKKFRINTTPGERVVNFHIFLDYFKFVTDSYKQQYDGWELEKMITERSEGADSGEQKAPAAGNAN